jgi:chromosome segregation ATPase
MDDCTPDIDTALWRIAELGARCGQRAAGLDRRPMWAELEGLIADLGGALRAARQDEPPAALQVRRLRQELKAAVRERDAALAEVAEHRDEAETELAGHKDRITGLESALLAAVAAREASRAASEDVISQLAARAQGHPPQAMAIT